MSGFQLNADEFRSHYNNLCSKWHELDAKAKVMEGQLAQASESSLSGSAGVFRKVGAAKDNAAKDAQAQLASVRAQQAQMSRFLEAARLAFVDYGTTQEQGAVELLRAAELGSDPGAAAAVAAAEGLGAVGVPGVAVAAIGAEEAAVVSALGGQGVEASKGAVTPEASGGPVSKGPFNVGSIGLSEK